MDQINFENVNIKINIGNINCIIGSNGSGKSYILNLIYKYLCNNNKSVYYMPQYLDEEIYSLSVLDELKKVMKNISVDNKLKYINNASKIMNLDFSILDKDPKSLNELNLRKVNIIKMFLSNCSYLLLDEPTLLLNEIDKNTFIKIISKMKKVYKKTIIIATNDIELVNIISDDIILINDKNVIQNKKEDIFKDIDLLEKCNINIPDIIEFSNLVHKKKGIKCYARDDINDLIKDILRNINTYSKGE